MKRINLVTSSLLLGCSTISIQTQAAMPSNAILEIDAGVPGCIANAGTYPNNCTYGTTVVSGSYFTMDLNGNGKADATERTGISPNANILLGKIQPASGSHAGIPDGTESPGIDLPWNFGGNTGMHQSTASITRVSDNAGTVELDFNGWSVTWNGIANIPMGRDAANFPADTGKATVVCAVDCTEGDTFVLDYATHVDSSVASGFEGVPYTLHITGSITTPGALTTDATTIGPGAIAQNASSTDGRITMQDVIDGGISADTGFSYGGGLVDFILTGTGATANVVIPLTAPIPANAIYRKYINGVWTNFTPDGSNLIASAAQVAGICPVVGDNAYNHTNGLVEGDNCLQITIVDNGIYDADANAGTIADPGGVATIDQISIDSRTAGTDGCNMSGTKADLDQRAEWLLVAGFIALLGFLKFKRKA